MAIARLSLLLTMVAMGAALVVSAWLNRRNVEQVSELLDRGQAGQFFRPIAEIHQINGRPASSDELAELVGQHRDAGLRYVAVLDPHGSAAAEAGERTGPPGLGADQPPGRGNQTRIGSRVRTVFRPPLMGPMGERPPPGPPHERRGRRPPDVVIEFEPTVSSELREQAARSFVFSSTSALALVGVAIALWVVLLRQQRQKERIERERGLAALGEMSAVLAHEIRNPLASLKGHAQLLAEKLGAETPHLRKVERIVEEAKRLEELSATLLDLVRSSSVERGSADPRVLLRDAASAVDRDRVQVDTSAAPETWSLDSMRMAQVFKNLMQNAVQASPDGAPVEVRAALERGWLVVSVRDHGAGLPSAEGERIFEAFHTTRTKGTGLGLAIARRIVELHGGRIDGANHPGGGAEFVVRMPG